MEPPVDARLQSMIRAVSEVIIPALDPADGLAQAQAELLLAHLATVRRQIDHLPRYHRAEYHSARLLARDMAQAGVGGQQTTEAAGRLREALARTLDERTFRPEVLRTVTEELAVAGEELVRACARDGEPAARDAVTTLAVAAGRASARRQLAWCDPTTDLDALLTGWEQEVRA